MGINMDVESMYYLSPLQEGLLFHHLSERETDPYFCQSAFLIEGELHIDLFENVWQQIVARHQIFRTAFVWEDVKRPLQIVRKEATIPFHRYDWREKLPDERVSALESLLACDQKAGFDFLCPPLMHLHLITVTDNTWYFVTGHHHILFDGWSIALLVKEVLVSYEAVQHGVTPTFTSPRPYRDYIAWVKKQDMQRAETYWRTLLTGFLTPTVLPQDISHNSNSDARLLYAEQKTRLSRPQTDELQTFARRHHLTVNTIIQGAWALLLQRYSDDHEVLFGMTVSGRPGELAGSDSILGLFINTLPVRVSVLGEQRLVQWLRSLQEKTSTLYQYQWTSLANIQRWSDLPAGRSLFDSIVVYQNQPSADSDAQLNGVNISPLSLHESRTYALTTGRNNYPLSLIVEPGPELQIILCYARHSFSHTIISGMLRQYITLLTAMISNEDMRLSRLPLLNEVESAQILVDWNNTEVAYSRSLCMHDLFALQVEIHPEAPAVRYEDELLTYQELDHRANQVAHYLQRVGIGPDVRVGLCLERSLDLIVGLLAVMKAGGAYLPLDPKLPQARLSYMLANSEAQVVLTRTPWSEMFVDMKLGCVCLDRDGMEFSALPESPVVSDVCPSNLAYVIYTSGSTGQPKGVAVEHRQLVHYTLGVLNRLALEDNVSFATVSTVGADLGNTSIFGALCSGQLLHILATDRASDPDAMAEYMHAQAVDVLKITPTHLLGLLEAAKPEQVLPRRCLILGGESVGLDLIARVRTLAPACDVINHYGPTETTVGVLTHSLGESGGNELCVPIGRPLPNVQAYILDRYLHPTPVGIAGELYISGNGLARGYLRAPKFTAERFVPNPFSKDPGGRLYKTGDRARYATDGNIEFLGRADHQVKLRGFRIELEEIKRQCLAQQAVCDAVVVMREVAAESKQLVAYVVGEKGAELDLSHLREQLAARLPEYMVPQSIVVMEALPRTMNGKVDRHALPAPDFGPSEKDEGFVAPLNQTERTLAAIWAEILQRELVGRHDSFFALGGDSILTLQVIARARRQGLKLTPKQMFEHPTIAQLAVAVGSAQAAVTVPPNLIPPDSHTITPAMLPLVQLTEEQLASIVEAVPGGAGNIQDIYPLAPLQEGILFHHVLERVGDPYLRWVQFRFATRERLESFVQTLQLVIKRHDILRTAFWWEDLPEPIQIVWHEAQVVIDELSFEGSTRETKEQLREHYDFRHYRMDVCQAPLIRGGLAQDPTTNQWWLHFVWHHLIGDHQTAGILLSEIEAIQQGQTDQLPTPLPFRNFIAQAQLGVSVAEHEAFFSKMLGEVNEPTTPFGLLDVHGDGAGSDEVRQAVEPSLVTSVRQCAQQLEVSVASLLHLAWALVLARLSGRHKVVFGTVLMGRMHGEEEMGRIPGLFINTLPLRIDIGIEGVADSVRTTQKLLMHLLQHEQTSLSLAQRCSGIAPPAPLFTALLNFRHTRHGRAVDRIKVALAEEVEVFGGAERTNYPVAIHIDDDGESLVFTAQVAMVDQAGRVCELLQTALTQLVEAVVTSPDTPLQQLDVLPISERQQLLETWNATEQDWAERAQSVVELFEAQVAQTPQAVAVVCDGQEVTYAELDAQANRVAQVLHAEGVGPEVLVGLYLERSMEMLVGLLGVWKAGGAYMPLDPSYPPARLTYILEDAKPAVLLTHSALRHTLSWNETSVLCLDAGDVVSTKSKMEDFRCPVPTQHDPFQTAYVIYTSGSTGKPKGVMISHQNVRNFLKAMREQVSPTAHDQLLAVTSLSFDISVLELFLPLMVGARVVLVDTETAHDGLRLLDVLDQGEVTLMQATPATWRMLLDVGWKGKPGMQVFCGGETLTTELASELRQREVGLWNMYGPTETTVWSAIHHVTDTLQPIPIGHPIANTQFYVLDRHLQPVPMGVTGELYIGGMGVARGYWQRPALTAERFVPNPFNPREGERLYCTGDLARYREDGRLEFQGRKDRQVKLRGFRIELGEVEAALSALPGIHEVVVVAREKESGDKRLVGYVVGEAEAALDLSEIKELLRDRLPEYMVPSQLVTLETFPRTPNGKVDHKALPDPDMHGQFTQEYIAPRTPTEETLAGIWREVLGLEQVGVHDRFFDIGGHSLRAIQVSSRLRKVFKLDVSLRDFFERSTIAEGATYIEARLIEKLEELSESEAQSLLK